MRGAGSSWVRTHDTYDLTTNLAELPYGLHHRVADSLDQDKLWASIIDQTSNSAYSLSVREYERISKSSNPAASLLVLWGNRGQTVIDLLQRLQSLSKIHGAVLDSPQLALRRKFVPLIWSAVEQVTVKKTGCDDEWLTLICHAKGFPYPCYQWRENGIDIESATGRMLLIPRCLCQQQKYYTCKVRNEIKDGMEYSNFYRSNGKRCYSELISNIVELTPHLVDALEGHWCKQCKSRMSSHSDDGHVVVDTAALSGNNFDKLVATDKVALVISNCNYESLPNLVTPHYDAELLAQSLQEMGFKTVTLGDLRLKELKFFIKEYRKLLGSGVYAIFYFVGHGFEKNGENYLLAVDSPFTSCDLDNCISLKWTFSIFEDACSAMNLVLLDVCRQGTKARIPLENADVEMSASRPCITRNTICGFSTSSGISAYEVYGERNGVFMKHLLKHIADPVNVLEMLTRTFQDISNDQKVLDVQVPELRSNMTLPRSLLDPLISDGHTVSFNHHTLHWRFMHELPDPVHIHFEEQGLRVTVWYDFAGHFTNKVYIFSSVDNLTKYCSLGNGQSSATELIARLRFSSEIEVSSEKLIVDGVEGLSLCWMLSNLQRTKGAIHCAVYLTTCDGSEPIASKDQVALGDVLITRIYHSECVNKTEL